MKYILCGVICCAATCAHGQFIYTLTLNLWTQFFTEPQPVEDFNVPMMLTKSAPLSVFGGSIGQALQSSPEEKKQNAKRKVARLEHPPVLLRTVLASGIQSPDGIAVHPETHEVYVSEESPGRISLILDAKPTEIINASTKIVPADHADVARLRSPEGIAFSPEGDLYAVEDIPGGRLIRFIMNEDGTCQRGEEVPLPGAWRKFAWEDVAVGPQGQILVAGSDLESLSAERDPMPFSGVILYRDAAKKWWRLHSRPFASFSAIQLSADGRVAFYTCELTGEVGWIDLNAKRLRIGGSVVAPKSPEGICLLPNGLVLVAEERGRIMAIDPVSDSHAYVETGLGNIESVKWDRSRGAVLVTADGKGKIYSLIPQARLTERDITMDHALWGDLRTATHVPTDCPDFLESVLELGGVRFEGQKTSPFTFREFARRVPFIAVDALTVPVNALAKDNDPIVRVQFVVFYPNQLRFSSDEVAFPVAAFVAVHKSGKIVKTSTEAVTTHVYEKGLMDLGTLGNISMPVPCPAGVTITEDGSAGIQFLGMQKVPDYHLVLDPNHPEKSYMIVDDVNGCCSQYKIDMTSNNVGQKNLVISYSRELHEQWHDLGFAVR